MTLVSEHRGFGIKLADCFAAGLPSLQKIVSNYTCSETILHPQHLRQGTMAAAGPCDRQHQHQTICAALPLLQGYP